MPTPTINDVQAVDPVLTNMLIGYMQADTRFVAGRVFPAVPVDKDSGTYYVATKKYFFFDNLGVRAPGGEFNELNVGLSTATYTTLQNAGAYGIPDEVRANSQVPMDLEQLGLRMLAQSSMIRKEVAWATDFMAASVWGTTDNNSAIDWDDNALGDPVNDILTARRTISNNTGVDANTMVCGYIVHQGLVNHPDVLDRIKYTTQASQGNVESALGALFGLSNYWVAKATYSNTNESAAFSATAIIDDDALICHVDPGAGIFGATAGKTFTWQPGGGLGSLAPVWRDQARHRDVLQHKEQWDQVVTASDLGYIYLDVV